MRLAAVLTFCALFAGFALATDKLILKDGQVVTGDILEESERDIRIVTVDDTIRIPRWAIEKIERDEAEGSAQEGTPERTTPPRRQPRRPNSSQVRTGIPPTPALLAWIDTCVEQLASDDRGVRFSANAALRSAGDAARPALEEAAAGDDPQVSQAALALLGRATARKGGYTGIENLSIMLNLTEEQRPEVEKIFEELRAGQHEAAVAARASDADRSALSEKLSALREEADRKLAGVLDDEQMKRYRGVKRGS